MKKRDSYISAALYDKWEWLSSTSPLSLIYPPIGFGGFEIARGGPLWSEDTTMQIFKQSHFLCEIGDTVSHFPPSSVWFSLPTVGLDKKHFTELWLTGLQNNTVG